MRFEIKHCHTQKTIFDCQLPDKTDQPLKTAFEKAVASRADLSRADLYGAKMSEANVLKAKDPESVILSNGVCCGEFVREVVPALCTAGGKKFDEVADEKVWNRHDAKQILLEKVLAGATATAAEKKA